MVTKLASLLKCRRVFIRMYYVYKSAAKERMMRSDDDSMHTLIADKRVCAFKLRLLPQRLALIILLYSYRGSNSLENAEYQQRNRGSAFAGPCFFYILTEYELIPLRSYIRTVKHPQKSFHILRIRRAGRFVRRMHGKLSKTYIGGMYGNVPVHEIAES